MNTVALLLRFPAANLKSHSADQTRLYYKIGFGWHWMQSSPFALLVHDIEALDEYVSEYAKFYLTQVSNDNSWLSQILAVARSKAGVSCDLECFDASAE